MIAPDAVRGLRVTLDLVEVAGPLRVLRFLWSGPSQDGGQTEVVFWATGRVRDGRVVASVVHPSEEDALLDLHTQAEAAH